MSYNNSNDMSNYIYKRNYGLPFADKKQREKNLSDLKIMLPQSERYRLHLYIDPGGNISCDSFGNLKPDINKVLDSYKK